MTDTITRTPRTLAVVRNNYVPNPRQAVDVSGYSARLTSGSGDVTRITGANAPVSQAAARLTLTATSTGRAGIFMNRSVVAGREFTFSAYLRPSIANRASTVSIVWRDASNTPIIETSGTPTAHATNTWERREVTGTAPEGTVSADLYVHITNGASSGVTIDVTGLQLEDGPTATIFFDGNRADTATDFYRWTGTPNASPSTANVLNPGDIITPNIIDGLEIEAEGRAIIHPIHNSTNPEVTLAPAGSRTGTLTLIFDVQAAAWAAFVLLRAASLFYLGADIGQPGLIRFAVTGRMRLELEDETRNGWVLTVPFTEA